METVFYALIGSFLLIAFQLKTEKDKRDKDPKLNKTTWAAFFNKNWDDFLFAIVCAVALGYLQEPFYSALIHWREWPEENAWDIYFDVEYLISACLGMFGTLIIRKVFHLGNKLINK